MTLNEVLESLGYITASSNYGKKNILRDGVVVFRGTAHQVWVWLHETSQHESGWITQENNQTEQSSCRDPRRGV